MGAFNKVKEITQKVNFGNDDDDDDDGDDQGQGVGDGDFYDCFGDVKKKLAAEKLLYSEFTIGDDGLRQARMFNDGFKKFKSQKIANQYKGKELKEYPRRHRFCSFLDQRKPDDKDNKDELIFFEPPKNCNSFPEKDQPQPMFYFDMSRTCIVPHIGYKNGSLKDEPSVNQKNQKKKLLESAITSQSNCNGAMILLSFHVESSDEIRCYIYINGQVLRFNPNDITQLLPVFFDKEFETNSKFAESALAKKLVNEMTKNLRDVNFDAFMRKYQSKPVEKDD